MHCQSVRSHEMNSKARYEPNLSNAEVWVGVWAPPRLAIACCLLLECNPQHPEIVADLQKFRIFEVML